MGKLGTDSSSDGEGPAPLFVGVCGHRFLDTSEIPVLRERARTVLRRLRSANPATPVYVLSGLAEGADQLVAEEALALGYRVVACLPMPLKDYRETFHSPDASEALDRLIERCEQIVAPARASTDPVDDYLRLGRLIADRSQVLIALWNGEHGEEGGTAQVVRTAICGEPHPYALGANLRDVSTSRPFVPSRLYWIACANAKLPRRPLSTLITTGEVRRIAPCSYEEAERLGPGYGEALSGDLNRPDRGDGFGSGYVQLTHFNREALRLRARGEAPADDYPEEVSELARAWRNRYSLADVAARNAQRQRRIFYWVFFGSVLSAVMLFEYVTGPGEAGALTLLIYGGLLVTGASGFRWISSRFDERYLTYRTLAEHTRVKMHLAEVREVSIRLTDHMVSQRDWRDWVGPTLDAWESLDQSLPSAEFAATSPSTLERVRNEWLEGQCEYFARRIAEEQRYSRFASSSILALVSISIVCTMVTAGVLASGASSQDETVRVILFGAVASLVLAGFTKHWSHYSAFQAHENRYRVALQHFEQARRAIDRALRRRDPARVARELELLGIEALRENSEWFTLHQERPAQVDT